MKKISFLAIVAFAALSMTSCKKDRTCTCTTTVDGVDSGITTTDTYTKIKKGTAKAHCVSTSKTETNSSTTSLIIETCKLK